MPTQILMPALSPTMEEGNLVKWHVKEGDTISSGDVVAEIETDKATMEVEAVDEGTIGKIVVAEGTEAVAVNAVIAYILEEGESAGDIPADGAAPAAAAAPAPAPAPESKPAPEAAAPAPAAPAASDGSRVKASPLARRMAAQAGLDLASMKGSGPQGRVVKVDVDAAMSGGAGAPKAAATTSTL